MIITAVAVKKWIRSVYESVAVGNEPAMAEAALEVVKTIALTIFIIAALGSLFDFIWHSVHFNVPAISGLTYTEDDVNTMDKLYMLIRYLPVIALISGAYYMYCQSNLQKGT